jgi:hypothetical protein
MMKTLEKTLVDISASNRTNVTAKVISSRIEKTAKKECSISRIK